jgi:Protein of unknown function (DUF1189)
MRAYPLHPNPYPLNLLMSFWRTLPRTVYGPDLYGDVPQASPGDAFAFYALWSVLLGLLVALVAIPLGLQAQRAVGQNMTDFVDVYPTGLVVSLHDGQVTTNQPQPNFIPLPKSAQSPEFQNLAVIDTTTPYSGQQLSQYRAVFWIGQDTIHTAASSRGQNNTIDLSRLQTVDVTLSKLTVQEWDRVLRRWSALIVPGIPMVAFMTIGFWQIWNLVWAFVIALGVWLIATLQRMRWSYWDSYRGALYAMTLPMVLQLVFIWRGIHTFFFFYTLIALAVFSLSSLAANKRPPRAPIGADPIPAPDTTGGALG